MQNRLYVIGAITALMGVASIASAGINPENLALQLSEMESLQSQVPGVHFLMAGERVSRIYGEAFATGDSAKESASQFVASHPSIFGGGDCTYRLTDTQDLMNGKFTAITYQQFVGEVPVDLGILTLLVRNEKEAPVVLASNSTQFVAPCGTKPLLTESMALQVVTSANKRLAFFTKPELAIHVGETDTRLTWTFEAESPNLSQPEKYKVFVDAITGEVLEWRNLICELDITGTVKGYATPGQLPDQANNPAVLTNLFDAKLAITGVSTTYTNSSGAFTLTNAGTASVTVASTLEGHWVKVVDNTNTTLAFTQAVTPPGPLNLVYNPVPAVMTTSQVNGLIQTTAVHDFVRSISATYPGVDIQMPCNVNVAGSGNAFYNGSSINFYNAGGVYPNTCYTTVVWHEYGHHIVNAGGTAQNGYGEGMGDVTSSLLGNTNNLGMDFRGQGTGPLRNAVNTISYPSSAEIHTEGMIMSGSFWLTLQQMNTALGTTAGASTTRALWLNSILAHPAFISPGITVDVLTLDDNDANLNNGTPHYAQIAGGFNPKNMTAPVVNYVNLSAVSLPAQLVKPAVSNQGSQPTIPITVQVTNGLETASASGVRLNYAIGTGAFQSVPMAAIGGNQYRGFIRQPAVGQSVRYYCDATSTAGHTVTGPVGSPTSFLSFAIGTTTRTTFSDTFETNLGWTVANSTSLTTGAWVRADPVGTTNGTAAAQPENDSSDAGVQCYFTGQGAVGGTASAQDVDGGPTTLTSPTFSMSGGNGIIEFSRWFYNDDGDDCVNVEISNDGGTSWVTLDSTAATPTSNSWIRRSLIVGNYITPTANMKVRVRTSDQPSNSVTEAAFDNFVVKAIR